MFFRSGFVGILYYHIEYQISISSPSFSVESGQIDRYFADQRIQSMKITMGLEENFEFS